MTASMQSPRGTALLATLLLLSALSALGLTLVASSSLERLVARNRGEAADLFHAGDAALELASRDLAAIADWNAVLRGERQSAFIDGPPGPRVVAPGVAADIATLTNQLTCGRSAGCDDVQRRATTAGRPWGSNNPWWRPFLYGLLPPPDGLPGVGATYVIVWVGDDGRETDGDPVVDGAGPGQEGRYMVRVRVEAFGPGGARHAIEAELARICTVVDAVERCVPGTRVQAWRVVAGGLP